MNLSLYIETSVLGAYCRSPHKVRALTTSK